MRIGITLDNVICNTKEIIKKYKKEFIKDNKISLETLQKDKFYKTKFYEDNIEAIYNNLSLKPYFKKTLNILEEKDNEIYIITDRNNKYSSKIKSLTLKYLSTNKIFVSAIIFDCKNIIEFCNNNNIELIIDNNIDIYNKLKNSNIKYLLYDDKNKYKDIDDKISTWKDLNI